MSDITYPAQLTADEAHALKRACAGLQASLADAEEELGDFTACADYLPAQEARLAGAAEGTALRREMDEALGEAQVEAADDARAFLAALDALAARIATVRAEFVAGLTEAAAAEAPEAEAA